ncbi:MULTISPECIES: response regulator [unclassified Sphingomonas]|uniref:response regulator n=1 Tax=unclassified Sphingomonas TaxID=196159 RepID=UPI002151C648|nr:MULTISPECIES: response regulator [unclassified Sphingomonas]MCR5871092.1 response regulator [Sphingomonas sp. J344]UUY00592.1 response regulator [Sphingomonas sp. J315]
MPPEPVPVLAVDDIPENLAALDALLSGEGVELVRARSGAEALELLLHRDFAVALLDVQMPGMDGFELAELMRGTERTRRIPIMFLTAVATDEMRKFRGYEAGAVDYLLKPVDPQIVRNKVGIFVELFQHRREIARQRDALSEALGRLRAHGDNSPLAVVELDGEQRILAWSNGAERLFGWRAHEVCGFRPCEFEWIAPEHGPAFAALIADMIGGQRVREMQPLRMRTTEGVMLDCECYCSALHDAAGRLTSVNVQILDVSARKRGEDTQRLLIGELNHRVKNTLASVQAIATQTLRHSTGPSDFAPTFIGRIHALAKAHSLLSSATWEGARLRELIEGQLRIGAIPPDRLGIEGPELDLAPEPALHLALVLHELVTNAHKYGSLSVPEGRADMRWHVSGATLRLEWIESGGPPVTPPTRRGFGTALIERSLKAEGGVATSTYAPDGLRWTLDLPFTGKSRLGPAQRAIARSAALAPAGRHALLTGKRFLIVEDEPLVMLELVDLLNGAGATVAGQASARSDALELARVAEVDGALLDGNLQGEMVDEIAAALAARGVPFLFVSGYGREHLPAQFDRVVVVTKPFAPTVLLDSAASLFGSEAATVP